MLRGTFTPLRPRTYGLQICNVVKVQSLVRALSDGVHATGQATMWALKASQRASKARITSATAVCRLVPACARLQSSGSRPEDTGEAGVHRPAERPGPSLQSVFDDILHKTARRLERTTKMAERKGIFAATPVMVSEVPRSMLQTSL